MPNYLSSGTGNMVPTGTHAVESFLGDFKTTVPVYWGATGSENCILKTKCLCFVAKIELKCQILKQFSEKYHFDTDQLFFIRSFFIIKFFIRLFFIRFIFYHSNFIITAV